jgi:nucleoside phosphorylase
VLEAQPTSTMSTKQPQQIIGRSPIVTAAGTLQFTAAAPTVPRTWEEEEAEEAARRQSLSEAWLMEMEAAANAQWAQWQAISQPQ